MNNLSVKVACVAITAMCAISLISCKKDSKSSVAGNTNDTNPPAIKLEDTLSRKWIVDSATHNGSFDNSSKNLELDIRKDGSYTLQISGYEGTWEFLENKTKVILDKEVTAYKTTWDILFLSSTRLEVAFISPFTGGKSFWRLKPL